MVDRYSYALRFLMLVSVFSAAQLSTASAQTPAAATQHDARVATEVPAEDVSETAWTLSAGATLNTGNSRSFATNIGSRFLLRRGFNAFQADAAFTYGIASLKDKDTGTYSDWDNNSRNFIGSLRYDRFFTADDAIFIRNVFRNDPFAGLDFRYQAQVGYARNFFTAEKRRIWGEVGYDFTYDVFHTEQMRADGSTYDALDQHSVRLFFGYDNRFNEIVQVVMGIEGLIDVVTVENVRITSLNELNLQLTESFKLGLRFNLLFDNLPAQGAQKLDTTTVLNVIYTLI